MLVKFLKHFWQDEEGQTSTEYILLVAAVAVIVMKFGGVAKEKLLGMTNTVFDRSTQEFEKGIGNMQ